MKMMKKLAAMLLAVCLIVPCFMEAAYAADGRISFGDPKTKAGETFSLDAAVRTSAGNIGDVTIKMTYDSSALSFVSGDGVTKDGDGALTYSGTGSSGELKFTMQFQALKEGNATVGISEYSASMEDGSTLTCQQGSSSITIEAGDGEVVPISTEGSDANGVSVEVDGQQYTLSSTFAEGDIPLGFAKSELEYQGQQFTVVAQETSGIKLGYLVDAQNKGAFFYYNAEDETFAPYMEVMISDETSIILLRDEDEVKLPKSYQKVTLTMNEVDFPAWQDPTKEGFYLLYAVNSLGEKSLYQYDDMDKTYQRFFPGEEQEETKKDSSPLGKINEFLGGHKNVVVFGGGLVFLLMLFILIVLAVKLSHRNRELDDLYDEYGIDEEEEFEDKPKAKKTKDTKFRKRQDEDDYFASSLDDSDYSDESDDYGYEEDSYDDEAYDYNDYEDDDFDFEDDYDLPEIENKKGQSQGYDAYGDGGFDLDDDFEIDFLDLD